MQYLFHSTAAPKENLPLSPLIKAEIRVREGGELNWCIHSSFLSVEVLGLPLKASLQREILARIPGSYFSCVVREKSWRTSRCGLLFNNAFFKLSRSVGDADFRRLVLALFACHVVNHNALVLHASVLLRDGSAVILLGNYGAGKTTVAIEMEKLGWHQIAGDSCLVTNQGHVLAGSRAVLVRKPPHRDMAPTTLSLPPGEQRWERASCHGGPYNKIKVSLIASIKLSLDTRLSACTETNNCKDNIYRAAERIIIRRNSPPDINIKFNIIKPALARLSEELLSNSNTIELKGPAPKLASLIDLVGCQGMLNTIPPTS